MSIRVGMGSVNELGNGYSGYGKLFEIPQAESDYEFLRAVDSKTMAELNNKYGILMDYPWQANTIAKGLISTLITDLAFRLRSGGGSGIGIEFYDIIRIITSIKTNDKAEKEGNINIIFEPGSKVDELIKHGPSQERYDTKIIPAQQFRTGNADDDKFYSDLEFHTRYNLSSTNGILLGDKHQFMVFAIGYTFLESLYLEILYRLSNMDVEEGEEKIVSVNFNDIFEIHGVEKNGEVNINMRPGVDAKLLIKCDEITEHTMGDDDD